MHAQAAPASKLARLGLALAPLVLASGFGYWMLERRAHFLVDDAYISFRYAANFAHGHGLVWNVGVPVEGYTCLSWVLMLAAIARAGLELTWPSVLLSAAFGLGSIELMRRIGRRALPERAAVWHALPPLLLACHPSFAHAMTSGMEETCFAFWVLLSLHLAVLARSDASKHVALGLALAAACLTRPEGVLVCAVAYLVELTAAGSRWRERMRASIVAATIVVSVVLAQLAFRLSYYGYPLPNTFYAKVIFGAPTIERGATHIGGFFLAGGWLMWLGYSELRRPSALGPWLRHGYALATSYLAYLLLVGGDHPHWFRFYIPLLPLPLLAAGVRLEGWTSAIAARMSAVHGARFALLACALALAPAAGAAALPFSEAEEPIVGKVDAPIKALMTAIERFFDEIPQHAFVAVGAIGYVGYRRLDLHILDAWGLTDAHIAHLDAAPSVKFGHDKQDVGYIARMKPDYMYVFIPVPAPPLAGYDICWPSLHFPAAVYRRNVALAPNEMSLGMPRGGVRLAGELPRCLPPAWPAPAPAPAATTVDR